jgi:hypothetical protein
MHEILNWDGLVIRWARTIGSPLKMRSLIKSNFSLCVRVVNSVVWSANLHMYEPAESDKLSIFRLIFSMGSLVSSVDGWLVVGFSLTQLSRSTQPRVNPAGPGPLRPPTGLRQPHRSAVGIPRGSRNSPGSCQRVY